MKKKKIALRGLLLLIALIFLAACSLAPTAEENQSEAVTPQATTAQATIPAQETAIPPLVQTPIPPISQLRVWIPPEVGARTEAGALELNSQIREFEAEHANIEIVIEQKPVEGPGGILNYLRTGRNVASAVLPDLIAVPTSILDEPGMRELVFPLNDLIDGEKLEDVYPAPAADILIDNAIYGFPFATSGLTHLVYDPAVVTDTIPLEWTEFISSTNHTLVFPADSREGAIFGLQFYLAEGGSLINDAGAEDLEFEPLTRALEKIGLNKVNLLQSHQMKTLDEAWQYYQLGLSEFVWTTAEFYLGQRNSIGTGLSSPVKQGYIPVPGIRGPIVPLTNSWAWAISTPDAARQAVAVDLLNWLTEPSNLASWSSQSLILPASRGAMSMLSGADPYYLFSGREMERADLFPLKQNSRVLDVIGEAVFQVLTTEKPPAVLAEEAITALRQ